MKKEKSYKSSESKLTVKGTPSYSSRYSKSEDAKTIKGQGNYKSRYKK